MLRDGAHWAGELAININQVYQGQKPDAAFAWLLPVSVALKAVVGWASAAGNAVLDFIGVFSGNAEALANNPGLAKFRQSLLEDVLPRLRTMATDVVAFLVGVVPPIFNTISGIFATLRPYVDGIGPSLRDASKYVISLVDAVARYFSGKEQDKNFKWVKTLLDDIKAVIDYISGIPDLLQKKVQRTGDREGIQRLIQGSALHRRGVQYDSFDCARRQRGHQEPDRRRVQCCSGDADRIFRRQAAQYSRHRDNARP
jgi:hypothetical protein